MSAKIGEADDATEELLDEAEDNVDVFGVEKA
jgi:hypothetical protein